MSKTDWRWLLLTAALACAQPATACDGELAALSERLQAHRVMLIGEIHGTEEAPAQVAALARCLVESGQAVRVGLEIPRDEQARIDTYMHSAGIADDRQALLAGSFWQREYQDGRSSEAMYGLIESLRQLALKADVAVHAFDQPSYAQGEDDAREAAMAANLEPALRESPQARWLVLAGNLHTRVSAGAPWDAQYQFLGYRLRSYQPYAVEFLGLSGSVYTCTDDDPASCHTRTLPDSDRLNGLMLEDAVNGRGHHGLWLYATSTASPPARVRWTSAK